jgi:tetratricopeptide (TPR) repeat protein
LLLGQAALAEERAATAIEHFNAALNPPQSLSEAKHLLVNYSLMDYWLGAAYDALGERDKAVAHWTRAATWEGNFQQMQIHTISDTTFWSAMALQRLGLKEKSAAIFQEIYDFSLQLEQQIPKIDYFATSLPAMLLFDEDMKQRQEITASFLRAQALVGLEDTEHGLALLRQLQERDRNHTGAADLLASLAMSVA